MLEACKAGAGLGAVLDVARSLPENAVVPHAVYALRCLGPDSRTKWLDHVTNMVVAAGRNDLLTQYFKGVAYTASWCIGLIDDAGFTAIAPTDTMVSHGGWSENTGYVNATRAALVLGTASAGSIDNSAAAAVFSINATATVRGAFIANNGAKGGTSGTLYSAGVFAASRPVAPGDTLTVTVTLTAS